MSTKVILTIEVPGSQAYENKLCFTTIKSHDKYGKTHVQERPIEGMTESFQSVSLSKDNPDILKKTTLQMCKRIPAYQRLRISDEAYREAIDRDSCPRGFKSYKGDPIRVWRSMTNDQRLMWHLEKTAQDFGGIVKRYDILDD